MTDPAPPQPSPPPPPRLKVAIPRETVFGERRVAATPQTCTRIAKLGYEVLVESNAGEAASFVDAAYIEAGARIVDAATVWRDADIVLKVRAPDFDEIARMREGTTLISFIWPAQNRELLEKLQAKKATVLAMDAVPRITRAQRMDALSAMANIAGYRAVIEAAAHFGRPLGAQTTAAGRIKPAQVLVARRGRRRPGRDRRGARARRGRHRRSTRGPRCASRWRASARPFCRSSARTRPAKARAATPRQMSDAYLAAEQALIAQHAKQSDIIVTTALVPGMPAPKLITSGAVVSMTHGSVIVDIAAEQGGNCALTERGKVVEKFGVTILGFTDLPSRMAPQASELYAHDGVQPARGRRRPRTVASRSTTRTRCSAVRSSCRRASSSGRRRSWRSRGRAGRGRADGDAQDRQRAAAGVAVADAHRPDARRCRF